MQTSLPSVPVLETDRLRLRIHRLTDFPDVWALWADPQVYQFISGKPATEQQAWLRLQQYCGHWNLLGYGAWAVTEKQSGAYVGSMGFADYRRTVVPPLLHPPELGWVMSPRFWGKGYAIEALRAIQAWGDAHFSHQPTYCIINPQNAASLKVAAKLGYQAVGDAVYDDRAITVFRRP